MSKIFTTIIILLALSFNVHSQGYKISVKVKNLKDSTIYLACHYGNGSMLRDSANLDNKGELVFKGDEKLLGGLYFLFLPNGKFFDFLVDKNQNFNITCDTLDFINTVKFENSPQNKLFYSYQRFLRQEYTVIGIIKEKQKTYITKLDSLMLLEDRIQKRRNKIYLVQEDLIAKYPDSLLSALIKSELPIIPPPAPQDSSGNLLDSTYAYKYIKQHYFDNINFSDNRLVRSNVLQNKTLSYLTRMVAPNNDSIIKEVDYIIEKSAANEEVYNFVLNNLFRYYSRSNIINDENIFVHIAEKYYLGGKAPWANKEFKQTLASNIKRRKLSLIGAPAPDFIMKNQKGKKIKLRDIKNKYTILYFYDIDCEICKEVSPRLMNFYRIIKDRGVGVVGIYIGKEKKSWLKYISDNGLEFIHLWDADNASDYRNKYSVSTSPLFFLLDRNQKILLKRVTIEQLMQYFNTVKD